MYSIEFHPLARQELLQAVDWYLAQNKKVAVKFQEELEGCWERIAAAPQQFPIVFSHISRANLNRFPYSILFEVHGNSVFNVSVFHQSRNPEIWKHR